MVFAVASGRIEGNTRGDLTHRLRLSPGGGTKHESSYLLFRSNGITGDLSARMLLDFRYYFFRVDLNVLMDSATPLLSKCL